MIQAEAGDKVKSVLKTLDRAFFHHARSFFDVATIRRVRGHFDAVEASHRPDPDNDRDARAVRLGTGLDSFRFDPFWYDLWRELPPASRDLLGPFTWVIFPVQIRHITQTHQLVPWHQDIGYQRLLGSRAHLRVITCFVPLEFDPTAASTLEFAYGHSNTDSLAHTAEGDHGARIAEFVPQSSSRFSLTMGDALLFGDHAIHRTVPGPDGRIDRRSFEFRLVHPDDGLDGKDYFDLNRGRFVRLDGSERYHP